MPTTLTKPIYRARDITTMPDTLRILCFGDSLTSGFHGWGIGSHPYSTALAARLRAAFPGRRIEVVTSGAPGDVVCGARFHERLAQECKSTHVTSAAEPSGYVVVL